MPDNAEIQEQWVKSASPESVAESPPAEPSAAAEPAPQDAQASAPTEASQGAPDEAASAGSVPMPAAPGASAAPVPEFIEARQGEAPFQLPKDLRLPLKRGGQIEYAPLEDVLKGGMMELDYRHKTAEVAQQRREIEQLAGELDVNQRRLKSREEWLNEQERQIREAASDPDKLAQFEEHQRQLQSNPIYRKAWEDAWAKRDTEAELDSLREREEARIVAEGAHLAQQWITELATSHPDVDPGRVRAAYARALQVGEARLDKTAVEAIYRSEAQELGRFAAPLRTEMEALKAELAQLKSARANEAHNADTQHALRRSKAPALGPHGGSPPGPPAPPKPTRFGLNELVEKNAEWARQR